MHIYMGPEWKLANLCLCQQSQTGCTPLQVAPSAADCEACGGKLVRMRLGGVPGAHFGVPTEGAHLGAH